MILEKGTNRYSHKYLEENITLLDPIRYCEISLKVKTAVYKNRPSKTVKQIKDKLRNLKDS